MPAEAPGYRLAWPPGLVSWSELKEAPGVGVSVGVRVVVGVRVGSGVDVGVGVKVGSGVGTGLTDRPQLSVSRPIRRIENARKQLVRFGHIANKPV
jgi:hypothetical protein